MSKPVPQCLRVSPCERGGSILGRSAGLRVRDAAVLAGLLCLGGCARESAAVPAADPQQIFPVAALAPTDTFDEREYVGEVQALRYTEVRARLRGVIESVAVDEGQVVRADQMLFSMRAAEFQQGLARTRAAAKSIEAELKLAELDRQNTRMLFDKEVVSNAEVALSDAKVEALTARLEEAKAGTAQSAIDLSYTKVRAPFDGVVNRIPYKVGSLVDENELLTTVADASDVLVYFRVSEREYFEYAALDPEERPKQVALRLAHGGLHASAGVIDATESEFSKETGNLALRARFPNREGVLKHGSSAKVVVRTPIKGALLVPQKATFEVQGKLFVYALDEDNRTRAQEILPKQRLKDSFVVGSGLAPSDRIVLEGVQKLREGMRVTVAPAG